MARPLRIDYPNAFHHVTCRGNERREIFRDDRDRTVFLEKLQSSLEIYSARLHGYVLMNNHFHLMVETPKANLSELVRRVNVSYSAFYNRRHQRVGHLYQGRFKAIVVEADSYLLELSRYVHLNPVRVGAMERRTYKEKLGYLQKYRWSSLEGYLSARKAKHWVNYDAVLGYVGGSRKRYAEFIEDGLTKGYSTPWQQVEGQVVLGAEGFWDRIKQKWAGDSKGSREQPSLRLLERIDPERVLKEVARYFGIKSAELSRKRAGYRLERALAMELLYRYSALKEREVGSYLGGMDYGAVSRERSQWRQRVEHDRKLKKWARDIEHRLSK